MSKTTAQVAVEAIVNENGHGYDLSTMTEVYSDAVIAGVAPFYTDDLSSIIRDRERGTGEGC